MTKKDTLTKFTKYTKFKKNFLFIKTLTLNNPNTQKCVIKTVWA